MIIMVRISLIFNALEASLKKFVILFLCLCASCTPFTAQPVPGPDKQGAGTILGGALGGGAGAIAAKSLTGAAGPEGALIGVGFGAVYGALTGLSHDLIEESQITLLSQEKALKEKAWAQDLLAQHYQRRLELHPSRDIFPADWFFEGDGHKLKPEGKILVDQIARLTKNRMPWARLVIASYSLSQDPESEYSSFINKRRAQSIAKGFVSGGVEPRRVFTKSVTLPSPVLVDPHDDPFRYHQAIEIIPLDY